MHINKEENSVSVSRIIFFYMSMGTQITELKKEMQLKKKNPKNPDPDLHLKISVWNCIYYLDQDQELHVRLQFTGIPKTEHLSSVGPASGPI